MAHVKEMRIRIACVKSTQKITKAMQMVAAAKLRRAQTAAEARAPTPTKMAAVIANIAAQPSPPATPLRCWPAPASDQRPPGGGRDRRPRPRRRLQLLDRRAARERIAAAAGRGQGREDHHRRPQGPRPAAPQLREADRRALDLRGVRQLAFANADEIAQKIIDSTSKPARSTSSRCSSARFKSVVTQTPTAQQLIPAGDRGQGRRARRLLRLRAGRGRDPRQPAAAATSRCRSSAPCWRTRPASTPRR